MHAMIMTCALAALLSVSPWARAAPAASVDHDEYRAQARQRLRDAGVGTDVDSLLKALIDDTRPIVRITAADLLTSLKEQRALPIMRSVLEREAEEKVQTHLGKDLLELEGEGAHALVSGLLARTKAPSDRIYLAGALAGLGDFAGYPDVLAGMDSKDTGLNWQADFALGNFVATCGLSCRLSPSPVEVALRLLKNPDHGRRFSALVALSHRLAEPKVVAALRATAETDQDEGVRKAAKVFVGQAEREQQQGHDVRN
jgi:HEAT repeat protein